jgi:hypothetical protein
VVVSWWGPPCLLRRVHVNLIEIRDTAVQGVLWRTRGPWLVLRDAAHIKENGDVSPIAGDVIVHRNNVSFVQVLP